MDAQLENELTILIRQAGQGDKESDDRAVSAVYDRLKELASQVMRAEKKAHFSRQPW